MLVYVATKNAGKFRELSMLLTPRGWRLEKFPGYADVVEGETSYAQNAALKAEALWDQLRSAGVHACVLGDDSGLEVGALGGAPGVLSARYGGDGATWPKRRALLLAELAATGSADRSARFVCALHFIDSSGHTCAVSRDIQGTIAPQERGAAGFSYDPIFAVQPGGRTFGELSEDEKNRVSHRARAAAALVDALGKSR